MNKNNDCIEKIGCGCAGIDNSYSNLLKKCQPEQREALEELREAFNLNDAVQFQPLQGGSTRARLYSFEVEAAKYVLRFFALGPNQPLQMRQNEIKAMKIAHGLKISPQCLFSDQNAVLIVMPFIEGRPLQKPKDQELLLLGEMLRKLHSFPGEYPMRYAFQERFIRHYEKAIKAGGAYPSGFDKEINFMVSNPCLRSLVPSHGDLNPFNFLINDFNHTISIIDWTSATLDDPFTDLSYVCLLSHLSVLQEKLFLTSYFGRPPSNQECEILSQEKAKVYFMMAVIWLRFSETLEERQLPLKQRIADLDAELFSPDLKSAQHYLEEGVFVDLIRAPKSAVKSYGLSFYKAYLESRSG